MPGRIFTCQSVIASLFTRCQNGRNPSLTLKLYWLLWCTVVSPDLGYFWSAYSLWIRHYLYWLQLLLLIPRVRASLVVLQILSLLLDESTTASTVQHSMAHDPHVISCASFHLMCCKWSQLWHTWCRSELTVEIMEEVKKSLHRHRSAPEVVSSCCSAATALEDFFVTDCKVYVSSTLAPRKHCLLSL